MQKGMKLTLILLGVFLLIALFCCGFLSLALSPVMKDNIRLGAEAGKKSEEYMRAISAKWESMELLDRSTSDLSDAIDERRLKAWFQDCSTRYGAYKSAKIHPSSINASGDTGTVSQAVVGLTLEATFEKANGRVEMRLISVNGQELKIDAFKIDGEGFAAPEDLGPFGRMRSGSRSGPDRNSQAEAQRAATNDARDVLREWSVEKLQDHASKEFLKATSKDELQKQFDELKAALGEFKNLDGKLDSVESKRDETGPYEEGVYSGKAEFTKGQASLKVQMIRRREGAWEILNFVVKPQKQG
jgi:hypothetical protein